MAEPISIQQLKDASEDAITLADFIYKPANVMIPRRLAADINSLQYYLDYMSSYAQRSYETYDEMLANAVNLPNGVSAFVTNDLDATKNGIYTYNGSSFVKGLYQPEKAAIDYVEAKLGGLEVFDGKVRAQDVSTADGSTQDVKNSDFRNELDALPPFEGGVLADTLVNVGEQLLGEGELSLKDFNSRSVFTVSDITELLKVKATDGRSVFVKGSQGGTFIYDSAKSNINDGGLVFNGWVRDIRDKRITPEMFGAKPNDDAFDNTTALNAAFATGFDLYGLPTDIYHVTKSIRTKGQKTYGGWKIHSNKATGRAGIWNKLVSTNDTGLDTSNSIRMLYVSSSWDFAELLAIKELGFNTIHHYVGMSQMGWDWDGDVFDLLNNAMTAGLKVSLGTEQDPNAISDLAAWVASVDSYPAVWAYSVYDEPVARGFSVAQQDDRIVTLRGLTKKMLTVVDYDSNPFLQKYSTKYDLCFVNSYARVWSTNAQSQNLDKMRRDYGVLKAQVGCPVIPCISAFTQVSGGMYASSVSEVVQSSAIFGKVARGSFAAFAWDGESDASITAAVRDNIQLQNLVRDLCNAVLPKPLETDVYLFGNANTQTDWGLSDVLGNLAAGDVTSADPITINAYPIQLTKGTVDSDRVSSTNTNDYAGIGFKGASARLVTTIPLRKYLKPYLESINVDSDIPFQTVSLCSTADGYTLKNEHNAASLTTDNSIIEGTYIIDNPNGRTLAFRYFNDSTVIKSYYRQLIRGVIICSDW